MEKTPYRTEHDRAILRRLDCVSRSLSQHDRAVADVLADRWHYMRGLTRIERENVIMLIRRAEASQDGVADPHAGKIAAAPAREFQADLIIVDEAHRTRVAA